MVKTEVVKITGVSVISVSLGVLMMVTSTMVIQGRETLTHNEVTLYWIWVFSLMTTFSGFLQCTSGICLLFRRIIIRRWVTVNAISFLVIMFAVCILSTTILKERPPGSFAMSSTHDDSDSDFDLANNENETEIVSTENFGEEQEVEIPVPVQMSVTTQLPEDTENLGETKNSEKPKHLSILSIYCGTLIANFILLPIFLGQMATRVKLEFKERHQVERTYVYPLMST